MKKTYIFETPEYWESRAKDERSFAKEKHQTVESVRIHKQNAEEYEAQAKKLREEAQQ